MATGRIDEHGYRSRKLGRFRATLAYVMLISPDVFRRLCRARDALCDAPEQPVSVHDLAALVEISPFHFIRQFEALFGVTPHQLRIRTRLERAKCLLAMDTRSVTEICLDVGFSSLGSFSDLFSRRVGMSPIAYRRTRRASVQIPGSLVEAPGSIVEPCRMGCLTLMTMLAG
jgi:AraC-like DNA-binding protein